MNGVRIGYDVYGTGRGTVVLLPALLMSRRMQEPLARSLALREIRVICLDYLGDRADGSPHGPSSFTSERLAAQVLAVLDQLGVERAVTEAPRSARTSRSRRRSPSSCPTPGSCAPRRSSTCGSVPSALRARSPGSSATAGGARTTCRAPRWPHDRAVSAARVRRTHAPNQ